MELFVAVLGASSYTYAEATRTQTLADFTASNARAFTFFGGVTKAVVPDQLKSAVTLASRYEAGVPPLDDALRSTIETFAADLAVLVWRAALQAVTATLGRGTVAAPVAVAAKRGRGRPRKAAAAAPAATPPVSKKRADAKHVMGPKRPAAALAQLIEKLADYIKAHPGVRMTRGVLELLRPRW